MDLEGMKTAFVILFLFPLALIAELRDEIFADLAVSVEYYDFENSLSLVEHWCASFPEDTIHAKACASLFLLMNNREIEALEIFNSIKDTLDESVSPELKDHYMRIFKDVFTDSDTHQLDEIYMCLTDPYICKFRGWKIKSFCGAALFTAGLFVTPFNPGVGRTMMLTAAGLMFDGTIGYMDEDEDRKIERKPEEQTKPPSPKGLTITPLPSS